MELDQEYLLHEYKALRGEALERFKMDYALQRNAIIAAGAILAFSFKDGLHIILTSLLMLAASGIMLVGYLQSSRMKKYGIYIGRYIAQIESAVYANSEIKGVAVGNSDGRIKGWEHALETIRSDETNQENNDGHRTILRAVTEGARSGEFGPSSTKVDARFFIFSAGFIVLFMLVRPFVD